MGSLASAPATVQQQLRSGGMDIRGTEGLASHGGVAQIIPASHVRWNEIPRFADYARNDKRSNSSVIPSEARNLIPLTFDGN